MGVQNRLYSRAASGNKVVGRGLIVDRVCEDRFYILVVSLVDWCLGRWAIDLNRVCFWCCRVILGLDGER